MINNGMRNANNVGNRKEIDSGTGDNYERRSHLTSIVDSSQFSAASHRTRCIIVSI
jgi:hypothetical protein